MLEWLLAWELLPADNTIGVLHPPRSHLHGRLVCLPTCPHTYLLTYVPIQPQGPWSHDTSSTARREGHPAGTESLVAVEHEGSVTSEVSREEHGHNTNDVLLTRKLVRKLDTRFVPACRAPPGEKNKSEEDKEQRVTWLTAS